VNNMEQHYFGREVARAVVQGVSYGHPTRRRAGPQGSLASLSPFLCLLVLQWNTTFDPLGPGP
jgi:hypothetical protein